MSDITIHRATPSVHAQFAARTMHALGSGPTPMHRCLLAAPDRSLYTRHGYRPIGQRSGSDTDGEDAMVSWHRREEAE